MQILEIVAPTLNRMIEKAESANSSLDQTSLLKRETYWADQCFRSDASTRRQKKIGNKWYTLRAEIKAILRGYHERSVLSDIHKVLGIY